MMVVVVAAAAVMLIARDNARGIRHVAERFVAVMVILVIGAASTALW